MNEDMSDMLKKLGGMLSGKEMPKDMQDIFKNITSNMSSDSNSNNFSKNSDESESQPEFDINMIMKMKSIMDSMKTNQNDPRANLLRSLKPYLNKNRKDKVEQYIKLFNMSKVFEVMNPLGGEAKK